MSKIRIWLFAFLLSFTILSAFNPQAKASADISACFDMVSNAVNTLVHVVDNVTAFAADPNCSAVAGSNTIMFGIVTGIVTAVNISGAFGGHDYDSCNGAINNAIASAIVAALTAALDDGSPLAAIIPDDARDPIKTISINLATDPAVIEQVNDWLSSLPVIGQMIGMMPCACRLSAAIVQAGQDIIETVKSAGDCGEFLVNCIGSPIQCAGSLFESGLEAIEDARSFIVDVMCEVTGGCPSPPPPPPTEIDCIGGATLSGDVVNFGGYGDFMKVSKTTNQFCRCGGDLKWANNNGVWSCGCPDGLSQRWPGMCSCPPGQRFGPGGCEICPEGSVEENGRCRCTGENMTLVRIGGKLQCDCTPQFREVAGKCVIPCLSPNNSPLVMLQDGTCCNPSRVTACGQCCSTPNCADERAPAPGRGLTGACCPPGQIKVLGGCGPRSGVTRAGFVCPPGKFTTPNGLDCTDQARSAFPAPQPPRNPLFPEDAILVRPPRTGTGSPGVAPGEECPPGQIMLNGNCVFPRGGAGTTTDEGRTFSPGVRRERDDSPARSQDRGNARTDRDQQKDTRGGTTFSPGVRDRGGSGAGDSFSRDRLFDRGTTINRGGSRDMIK